MDRFSPSFDLDALASIAHTLFDHDERGRLVGPAPHLHVLRSPDSVICRCHADLDAATTEDLKSVVMRQRGRPSEWETDYGSLVSRLCAVAPLRSMRSGLLYAMLDDADEPGPVVLIGRGNADLVLEGLHEWYPDALAETLMTAVVVDGRAVTICASVRSSASIHCAGVETLAPFRGRGFAARAVAGWGRAVRSAGAMPLYGTTFDNMPSQRLASRLGLRLIGSEFAIECDSSRGQSTLPLDGQRSSAPDPAKG